MAGFTLNGLAAIIKKLESAADGMSLHSADPGEDGVSELVGGGYQRRGAPLHQVDNTCILNNPQSFNCPAGTVAYVGIWQDKNSTDPEDFIGGFALDNPHTFGLGGGIFTIEEMTIPLNSA